MKEGYIKIAIYKEEYKDLKVYYKPGEKSTTYAVCVDKVENLDSLLKGISQVYVDTADGEKYIFISIPNTYTRNDRNDSIRGLLFSLGLKDEYEVITML